MSKQTIAIIIVFIALAALLGVGLLEFGKSQKSTTPENETSQTPILDEETEEKVEPLGPQEVVQKFIEADMAGARLGGETTKEAPEIGRYFTFPSLGGDLAMVIDKYEIIDEYPSENDDSYFVKVNYFCKKGVAAGSTGIKDEEVIKKVPGEVSEGIIAAIPCNSFFKYTCPRCFEESEEISFMSFDIQKEIEIVTFQLTKDEEGWKIDFPIVMPHISEETLQKHLQSFQK